MSAPAPETAYDAPPAWVVDRRLPRPVGWLEEAFRRKLLIVGEDPERDGLRETPERAAKAWLEMMSGYEMDPADLFKTFEPDGYDEMVAVGGIGFFSHCEHHAVPFFGQAHVAYLPDGKIVGLSKIPRLVEIFAKRLQVQERMTKQIADTMTEHLEPKGVAVLIRAQHLCMECRGVRKIGAVTTTSSMTGAMRDNPAARAEALAVLRP